MHAESGEKRTTIFLLCEKMSKIGKFDQIYFMDGP